jgi:hypothetical protein
MLPSVTEKSVLLVVSSPVAVTCVDDALTGMSVNVRR